MLGFFVVTLAAGFFFGACFGFGLALAFLLGLGFDVFGASSSAFCVYSMAKGCAPEDDTHSSSDAAAGLFIAATVRSMMSLNSKQKRT